MRPAPSSFAVVSASWASDRGPYARFPVQKRGRAWFADLLRRAFPAQRSERALCQVAAVALEVSPTQVRAWLHCEADAKLTVVLKVMVIAGAEVVLRGEGGS